MKIIITMLMCFGLMNLTPRVSAETTLIPTPGVNEVIPEVSDPRIFNPASGVTPIAGTQETVLGMVDLSSFVENFRFSTLIDSKGKLYYGGHIPVITFIGKKSKIEYININAGIVYSSEQKKSDFMLSAGIRIDSYLAKFGNSYQNVQTAKLPAIEIGPFVSYGFNSWMYGGMIAARFGGK